MVKLLRTKLHTSENYYFEALISFNRGLKISFKEPVSKNIFQALNCK